MLRSLSVKNFILIDKLELEFNAGLCAITGESGSGKSMLVGAILFALGKGKNASVIKNGAKACIVTVIFTATSEIKNVLSSFQIECDNELFVKCIQTSAKNTKHYINDQIVTPKTLAHITDALFELHGQKNHTNLLDPSSHLYVIDCYGELLELRKEVERKYNYWQSIVKEIALLAKDKAYIEREIDYLSFVVKELFEANIREGEAEILSLNRAKLQNRDKELKLYQNLNNELSLPEIDQVLNNTSRIVSRSEKDFPVLSELTKYIDIIYNNLEEARELIGSAIQKFYLEELESMEEIEDRLYKIKSLARKYNIPADNIPEFHKSSEDQLKTFQAKIHNAESLESKLAKAEKDYFTIANLLSHKRHKIIEKFEQKVSDELKYLKMEKAKFKVEILTKDLEKANSAGIDQVRFIASTNPGVNAGPIDKIASGGELSRFMLSMRVALLDKASKPTIIFDEIDKGVGGLVADSLGDRLKALSKALQVIVITHQPQVAGKADQHILVYKDQSAAVTKAEIKVLSKEQRIYELARMISGKSITDKGLEAARELFS